MTTPSIDIIKKFLNIISKYPFEEILQFIAKQVLVVQVY